MGHRLVWVGAGADLGYSVVNKKKKKWDSNPSHRISMRAYKMRGKIMSSEKHGPINIHFTPSLSTFTKKETSVRVGAISLSIYFTNLVGKKDDSITFAI